MKPDKTQKPIFSDVMVCTLLKLDKRELKKVLANLDPVLKALSEHGIRVVPHVDMELDLNELEEKEPDNKKQKLVFDCMFG